MMMVRMNEDDGYVEGEEGHNWMKNNKEKKKKKTVKFQPPRYTCSMLLSFHP